MIFPEQQFWTGSEMSGRHSLDQNLRPGLVA
jgi:hypothetical protein